MTKQEKFALAESKKKTNDTASNLQTYTITEDMINQIYHSFSSSDSHISTLPDANHTYYRKTPIQILLSGKPYTAPAAEDIPHLMEHFIGQITTSKPMFHPIEFSVYVHKRIIDMQPFPDNNTMVAFELMNYILKQEGYPSILIPESKKSDYENALIASQTPSFPDMEELVMFITDCVLEAQNK